MKKQFFQICLLSGLFALLNMNGAMAQLTEFKLIPYRKGELWGYADITKKIVIAPEYTEANFFVEGHAIVRKIMDINGKKTGAYGVIDGKNKVVVPIKYYDIRFQKDTKGKLIFECVPLALKETYDYYGIDGKQITPKPDIEQSLAKRKTAVIPSNVEPVQNGELYGLLRDGKDTVASAKYQMMASTTNGYFLAAYSGKFGIIDVKGGIAVPFEYMRANPMGTGFAVVKDKTLKEGFVSPEYKYTIPCKYFKVTKEYGKFIEVKLEGSRNLCIIGSDGTEYCEE
ncbi:MAG: hypothetical protein RI894_230 [Bacteroidota bacterium]|jgi:hypothetical protein